MKYFGRDPMVMAPAAPGVGYSPFVEVPLVARKAPVGLLVFGVVLPVLVTLLEATLHLCASVFFDPLPTPVHLLACLAVPAAVGLGVYATHYGGRVSLPVLGGLYGIALASSIVFTLRFLPLLPYMLAGTLLSAVGIAGLLPLAASLATLAGWRGIATRIPGGLPGVRAGIWGLLLVLLLVETPGLLTVAALQAGNAGLLRATGNTQTMARVCRGEATATGLTASLLAATRPIPIEEARRLFQQAKGYPFTQVAVPAYLGQYSTELRAVLDQ